VIWLPPAIPTRRSGGAGAVAALRQSVAELGGQIQRSLALQADIAVAIRTRRYELYRSCAASGGRASERGLAAAQRAHLAGLLLFVHAIAAAGGAQLVREGGPPDRLGTLSRSIWEFEASVARTRRLSRDMLTECQGADWRGSR